MSATTEPTAPTTQDDIIWNGGQHSYRPTAEWRDQVSSKLEFHSDIAEDLDPVSYEVLRNRFWTINMSHGDTITRISGSPIFQALDFSMTILTEDGNMVVNAPFIQYLNSGALFASRYVMEHYSETPGIEDGDIFLSTDPWVAAVHQMDVCLSHPVFVEGKLFCWVSNAGHHYDLGGIVPGGWPQNAPDVFSDPIVIPPIKMVERGEIRPDLEAMFLRQSRMPDLVALDLRAQIAGVRMAAKRVKETCDEFGPEVVKAAMRRVLEQGRQALVSKLEAMPDGRWSEIRTLEENMPGDRGSYPIQLNIEKRGDRLIVDNKGTAEQMPGPIGFPYLSFEGGINAMVSVMLLYEQTFAIGSAIEQIDYAPEPGRLSCVDYPAAVSGGIFGVVTHMNQMTTVLTRMLRTADGQDPGDLLAAGGEFPMIVLAGSNDRGEYFGTALMDPAGMGSGARGNRDGVDTGGPAYSPLMKMPDVETTEKFYPLMYLYRRNLQDSGGIGQWRGGIGFEYAVTPYRADGFEVVTNTGGSAISSHASLGLFGGYPSPAALYEIYRSTDIEKHFAARSVPQDLDALEVAERTKLRGKSNGEPMTPGDIIAASVVGGGGYGDPLDRDAEAVARDVALDAVSRETARGAYGVVIGDDGALDRAATEARRGEMLAERASWRPARDREERSAVESMAATGEPPRTVHEYVEARDVGGARALVCSRCETVLGGYRDNYRLGLLLDESPVTVLPLVEDPSFFIDTEPVLRRYCCPGCSVLMATEVTAVGAPILDEMRLA